MINQRGQEQGLTTKGMGMGRAKQSEKHMITLNSFIIFLGLGPWLKNNSILVGENIHKCVN